MRIGQVDHVGDLTVAEAERCCLETVQRIRIQIGVIA